MLLPHDRVVSDFSWLQASHERESTFKAAPELEDEELFLYGNNDTAQHMNKTSSADFYQNGGQSKPELNSFTSQTRKQDKPTLGSLEDFVLKQPLQLTSSSLASSYLDSSELKNILKSVNLASEPERNTQWPRQEKHLYPVSHGPDSGPKPAVKETHVLQALESLQSLIKGKVLFFMFKSFLGLNPRFVLMAGFPTQVKKLWALLSNLCFEACERMQCKIELTVVSDPVFILSTVLRYNTSSLWCVHTFGGHWSKKTFQPSRHELWVLTKRVMS